MKHDRADTINQSAIVDDMLEQPTCLVRDLAK